MTTYSPEQRERLRESLVSAAKTDARIAAAAHTGSLTVGRQDRWSDIDLAFCVASDFDIEPAADFAAVGRTFSQIFGPPARQVMLPPTEPAPLIGMAWLYALHVRSSLARGRFWQAEYMLSGMRDQVLMLACIRHGLSSHHARGVDDLPDAERAALDDTLARSLEPSELRRAFAATSTALGREVAYADTDLAARLDGVLSAMVWQVRDDAVLERSGTEWISSPGSSSA